MTRYSLLLVTLVILNVTGCAAAIVAGAAGAGIVASDKEAARTVGNFFRNLDETLSRQLSNALQTRKDLDYQDSQGLVIQLKSSVARPSKVQRGHPVTVTITYALLGTPAGGSEVNIKETLWFGKKRLAVIFDQSFQRTDGTWEDRFQVTVPETATPGTYVLGIILSVDKLEAKGHEALDVTADAP